MKDVVGKTPRILKSGKQSSDTYSRMWETIINGSDWNGELENKKNNGELYWVFCSISSVKDADGKITHFIGIEEDITEHKQAREQFARQLIASQEQERKRLASELHDSLGQDLLVIKNRALMGLQLDIENEVKEQFQNISSIVDDTLKNAQEISQNLRPYQLDRLGLTETIKSTLYRIEDSTSIFFKMTCDNVDHLFNQDEEINIFRIIQECLNNIIKHSGADQACLNVNKDNQTLYITVEDNCIVFDADEFTGPNPKALGFGLMGITERVRILNGTYDVKSAPSRGTIIKINVPINHSLSEDPA
jgi:signal transduction histidine kinase